MTSAMLPSPFNCNINIVDYRKLWQSSLEVLRIQFENLKIPRSTENISSLLDELNDFDLFRHSEDINGILWEGVHPDAGLRDEAARAHRAFTAFNSKVTASSALAENVALYETTIAPTEEDTKRMLESWKRDLKQGGAYLQPEKKARAQELTAEIEHAMTEFKNNVRSDDRCLELSKKELNGVPDDFLVTHPVDERSGKIRVSNRWADLSPILEYCHSQATRERAARLWDTRASLVNEPVLKRLLMLRREQAELLGYKNWAEYQLEGTMMKTAVAASSFLDSVFAAVNPRAEKEKAVIAKLLKDRDQINMISWGDIRYGLTLLKSKLLPGFDPKDTRQYFPVARSFPAIQKIAQDLFRIRFQPMRNVRAWHSSVSACLVYDTSSGKEQLLGRLFFDIYHRDGKNDGASAWFVRPSVSGKQRAEVVLVANLEGRPGSCMSYEDLKILLHELGHCVHALLGKQRYERLSGPMATQMDFMEMPSQMLELWLTEKTLFDFAVNEKGQRISEDVLDKLLTAEEIGRGLHQGGQLFFARLAVSNGSVTRLNVSDYVDGVYAQS